MQQHDRSFHVHGVKVSLFLLITLISTGFLNTFFVVQNKYTKDGEKIWKFKVYWCNFERVKVFCNFLLHVSHMSSFKSVGLFNFHLLLTAGFVQFSLLEKIEGIEQKGHLVSSWHKSCSSIATKKLQTLWLSILMLYVVRADVHLRKSHK